MNSGLVLFAEKTKEELIEVILQKEKRIQELEKKLQEKEKAEAQKKFLKTQRLLAKAKHPKTPGQKAGHPGFTRVKPKTIDRVVEQTLTHCPDCSDRLSGSQEIIEHIQEDNPHPVMKVKEEKPNRKKSTITVCKKNYF